MGNPFKFLKRRNLLPRRKYGRLGVTSALAAAALVIMLIAGWLIDRGGSNETERALVRVAQSASNDPVTAIANAARANRIVMLSDIHVSPATKRLAVRAIEKIVATSGLDVVVLEVGADQQPVIDQYLESNPEDASVLVTNERSLRQPGPASRDYLEIYRVVWKLNQKLGPGDRVRIVAADLPGWPPARSMAPAERARRSAEREAHMQKRIQEDVLRSNPSARMLVFVTGFHVLKSGIGEIQTGGSATVRVAWLGSRLGKTLPEEVYSFLVDAPGSGATTDVMTYHGTSIAELLQRNGANRTFVTPITSELDAIRQPLVIRKTPGLSFEITPRDYQLHELADAYIHLK
jgi:hypothetical protein